MRISAIRSLLCLAVAVTAGASAAHGQKAAPTRRGLWFSGGMGWGSLGCPECADRTNGLGGGFVVGGSLGPTLLVGGGAMAWTDSKNGTAIPVGLVDARFRFYTSPTGGLHFTFGAGPGSVHTNVRGVGTGSITYGNEWGVGLLLGAGYDIKVARRLHLTPFAHYFSVKTENLGANAAQIGLSITAY
jgi:hypothetical protein